MVVECMVNIIITLKSTGVTFLVQPKMNTFVFINKCKVCLWQLLRHLNRFPLAKTEEKSYFCF